MFSFFVVCWFFFKYQPFRKILSGIPLGRQKVRIIREALCACCKIHIGDYVHIVKFIGGGWGGGGGGGGLCPCCKIHGGLCQPIQKWEGGGGGVLSISCWLLVLYVSAMLGCFPVFLGKTFLFACLIWFFTSQSTIFSVMPGRVFLGRTSTKQG